MSKPAGVIDFATGLIASVIITTQGLMTGQYVVVVCGFVALIAFLVMIIVIADVEIVTTSNERDEDPFAEIDSETTPGMDI
jgi:phosphotransferase system  glucose/maltose/N-acetylglucosamine-specific IIC component